MIKIALIGSTSFCQRTTKLVAHQKEIQLDTYCYTEPKEASSIIQTLKPCDVILFSGSLPYLFAAEALLQLSIPVLYLKQDETAVAMTLLGLATKEQLTLNRISIDVREQSIIDTILNELNQNDLTPFIHVLKEHEAIHSVTDFHRNKFSAGKTDYAITSVHAVYEQLIEHKIPAVKMIDPESSILKKINLAKQQAILHKSDAAQIAIGLIKGNHLESTVKKIVALIQASSTEHQGDYTLFTTKGNIEFALKNAAFNNLLETTDADFKLAFGYGESIIDATENAQTALNFIGDRSEQAFYIVDANKKLQGPFPQPNHSVELKVHDPALVEMVEKTKLSPANISKLLMFCQSRQTKQFTANDLALYLDVTRRTAERTLKKLLQFDYARIVGEEMTYRQGRPRALYELNFPIYH